MPLNVGEQDYIWSKLTKSCYLRDECPLGLVPDLDNVLDCSMRDAIKKGIIYIYKVFHDEICYPIAK